METTCFMSKSVHNVTFQLTFCDNSVITVVALKSDSRGPVVECWHIWLQIESAPVCPLVTDHLFPGPPVLKAFNFSPEFPNRASSYRETALYERACEAIGIKGQDCVRRRIERIAMFCPAIPSSSLEVQAACFAINRTDQSVFPPKASHSFLSAVGQKPKANRLNVSFGESQGYSVCT